jgi:hypothetical protein
MRRVLGVLTGAMLIAFATTGVSASTAHHKVTNAARYAAAAEDEGPFLPCDDGNPLCAEVFDSIGYNGSYTGHDEPSLLFYDNRPGSGNNQTYRLRLPTEPPTLPEQDGSGGTWNFQNRIAFWLGLNLCDTESAPEYVHTCTPDSDSNIFNGSDPTQPDYIGFHPGTAFLELQWYPPGWVSFENGISCDAHQWCVAMVIWSYNLDMNHNVPNNADCLNTVGIEPPNFAFLTHSGVPQAPAAPLSFTAETFTPDATQDLFMNGGDRLTVSIHDSAAGLVTEVRDQTTGEQGSMTASVANGFAQINFRPSDATCTQTPYAFHPMYSTTSEDTRIPWAAHSYNVAYSDEIGHFEYCADVDTSDGTCNGDPSDPDGPDGDDALCRTADQSLFVEISGCFATDNDFDGTSYQKVWAGSLANPGSDHRLNSTSLQLSSPTFNQGKNYQRMGFEADLPRIEAADFGGNCNRTTGAGCTNPPPGANFYPIFSTRGGTPGSGSCLWQEGGTHIPGTQNTFGGTSTAEFGPLLQLVYPGPGFQPIFRYNDYRRVIANPCPTK